MIAYYSSIARVTQHILLTIHSEELQHRIS